MIKFYTELTYVDSISYMRVDFFESPDVMKTCIFLLFKLTYSYK